MKTFSASIPSFSANWWLTTCIALRSVISLCQIAIAIYWILFLHRIKDEMAELLLIDCWCYWIAAWVTNDFLLQEIRVTFYPWHEKRYLYKILHMSRQLCCRGMCKNLCLMTWNMWVYLTLFPSSFLILSKISLVRQAHDCFLLCSRYLSLSHGVIMYMMKVV